MKASPKERLNNKANKMVDLIVDEIHTGGSKSISAGFIDEKTDMRYKLTVKIDIEDADAPSDIPNVTEDEF